MSWSKCRHLGSRPLKLIQLQRFGEGIRSFGFLFVAHCPEGGVAAARAFWGGRRQIVRHRVVVFAQDLMVRFDAEKSDLLAVYELLLFFDKLFSLF